MLEVLSGPGHWRPDVPDEPPRARAIVTLSRLPGALGDEVARRVADELGYQYFDREILQRIAESAHAREQVVASLDDKDRPMLEDWLCSLTLASYLSPYGYREHLERVLEGLARIGGAVIVGRGAHLVLAQGASLRVLVVAPLAFRVRVVAERDGLNLAHAEKRVHEEEAERRAFLRRLFHAELADPLAFDLVVNTALLGVEGAAAAVVSTLKRLPTPAARA